MTTLVDETTQTPTEPGVINGGLRPRRTETPTPIIVIQVDSIDGPLKKVDAEGEPSSFPWSRCTGWGAYA